MNLIKKIAALIDPASLRSHYAYSFLILFLLIATTSLTKANKHASENINGLVTNSNIKFAKEISDSLNNPEIVKPDNEGTLQLNAKVGKASGTEIKYMPEWNAFGWFTANDFVEWQVEVPKKGVYYVYLEWSVSDEEAGKPFVFETKTKKLKGIVGKTGSWETFRVAKIGQIKLSSGLQTMKFLPDSKFEKGALLDLREIRLVPVQ